MKFSTSLFLLILLVFHTPSCFCQQKIFDIVSFGAKPDGQSNNTASIQRAIDSAYAGSGGRVLVPSGRFLTGVIHLRSGVELHLSDGAIISGSTKRADYGEKTASALIEAGGQHGISITGKGIIDGQGREVVKDAYRMLKEGTLTDPDWQTENPWHQKRLVEWNRPGVIHFIDCDQVNVSGITIKDAACWVQTYMNCSNLTIDSIRVESTAYWNNDGIDVVDCSNVRVSSCFVNAGDDGICLKSHSPGKWCENVRVENCTIRSSASAIKFGTASRGGFKNVTIKNITIYDTYRSAIALESVDGGMLEDVVVQNVTAKNTGNAIFIRLGHRNKNGLIGEIRHVSISNVKVEVPSGKPDKGYEMEGPEVDYPHNVFPASITGLPGHPVEDVRLENIEIIYEGGARKEVAFFGLDSLSKVPEQEGSYPEFSMFGELPAWGLYVRHASGVHLQNIKFRYKQDDFRPAMIFDDVPGLVLHGITIPTAGTAPVIIVKDSPAFDLRNTSLPFDRKKAIQIQ